MENASKALIIAGSIFIALMIIGALLLMFNNLTSYQNVGLQNTREAQVIEFNNQYETYNRENVRGSELLSLLNRVANYNSRKSTEGEEGKDIAFKPITIIFKVSNDLKGRIQLSEEGVDHLLENNTYTQSSTKNDFDDIRNDIITLEDKYGADALSKLSINLTKIFISTTRK